MCVQLTATVVTPSSAVPTLHPPPHSQPDALKSLMLTFVDDTHSVYALGATQAGKASSGPAAAVAAARLQGKATKVSLLHGIVSQWSAAERGVLLMDEVDVLLHSLKSEVSWLMEHTPLLSLGSSSTQRLTLSCSSGAWLHAHSPIRSSNECVFVDANGCSQLNFPVGRWTELDASPSRWDLPLFLFSLVLPTSRAAWRTMSETMNVAADIALSARGADVLARAKEALARGHAHCFLQSSPHLVLVQPSYYEGTLKPLVAEWAALWLMAHPSIAAARDAAVHAGLAANADEVATLLSEFLLQGKASLSSRCKTVLGEGFAGAPLKLFNLTRDWVCTFLPHCLAKVNRVHYGLLQAADWKVRCVSLPLPSFAALVTVLV
jgi:hypothetical protein